MRVSRLILGSGSERYLSVAGRLVRGANPDAPAVEGWGGDRVGGANPRWRGRRADTPRGNRQLYVELWRFRAAGCWRPGLLAPIIGKGPANAFGSISRVT